MELPKVLADTVVSGKSFQSLMVFGRNEDYLYWVRIRKSCCEWPLLWWAAAGISFDLTTLTLSCSIL